MPISSIGRLPSARCRPAPHGLRRECAEPSRPAVLAARSSLADQIPSAVLGATLVLVVLVVFWVVVVRDAWVRQAGDQYATIVTSGYGFAKCIFFDGHHHERRVYNKFR